MADDMDEFGKYLPRTRLTDFLSRITQPCASDAEFTASITKALEDAKAWEEMNRKMILGNLSIAAKALDEMKRERAGEKGERQDGNT